MTALGRKAALLGVCGLLFAAAAHASNCYEEHLSLPSAFIKVGGKTTPTGGPDPTIAFTITVRDFANNPIAGSNVELQFQNCTDTFLCTAGTGVDCTGGPGATQIVSGLTNAAGQVTFSVLGAANNYGDAAHCPGSPVFCPGAGRDCIRIYVDGCLLGHATAVDFDQNGKNGGTNNGVNAADLAALKVDIAGFASGKLFVGRSDYSDPGLTYTIDAADLSAMKTVVAASAGSSGSGAGCAAGGAPAPYCP